MIKIQYFRKLFTFMVTFILLTFISKSSIFAQEQLENYPELVTSFYSNIVINKNTSLTITEQIDYTTSYQKHGIYRYIPIAYNKDGFKEVLNISDIGVTDENGTPIQYTKTQDYKFLTLKIGDPDKTFSGKKKYVITYTVERGINQFDNHVELYWDITGEGWQVPIIQSAATISSKFASMTDVACFSGDYGSNDGFCNVEQGENQSTFFYSQTINYGDNMTVAIKFPKESELVFPSKTELLLSWLKHNWLIFLSPIPFLLIFFWWLKNGRDYEFISQDIFDLDENKPQRKKPIFSKSREPFVYEPLRDLTPGEAGALLDEKVDNQDIVAEILELARKKYLSITVTKKTGFLAKGNNYQFTKLANSSSGLPEVQSYLFDELFVTGNTVTVDQLKGTFYTVITAAKNKIETRLVGRNIYTRKPSVVKVLGIIFIVSSSFVINFCSFLLSPLTAGSPSSFLSFFLAPFGILIALQLGQKTAVGNNLWLQTRGLRKTIQRGKWREEINEKHLFIENVLPFSVALGVVNQLTKDMQDLEMQPPEYIHTDNLAIFASGSLINDFSTEVSAGLSYNPSSSSSGGSGFSDGGSSGGGGGGGGGGSW